jgi:hypothetical protein
MGPASVWVRSGTPAPLWNWGVLVPRRAWSTASTASRSCSSSLPASWAARGSFGTRSYVQSLFYGPLALAQQVAAAVPEVGGFLFAPVAAGSLIPTTTSLKAAHGCSGTRAVLTWVIPIVLNVVVVVGVVVLLSRGHH